MGNEVERELTVKALIAALKPKGRPYLTRGTWILVSVGIAGLVFFAISGISLNLLPANERPYWLKVLVPACLLISILSYILILFVEVGRSLLRPDIDVAIQLDRETSAERELLGGLVNYSPERLQYLRTRLELHIENLEKRQLIFRVSGLAGILVSVSSAHPLTGQEFLSPPSLRVCIAAVLVGFSLGTFSLTFGLHRLRQLSFVLKAAIDRNKFSYRL